MKYTDWLAVTYGGPSQAGPRSAPQAAAPARQPLTCAECGTQMVRGPGSLPQGEARCHPCRRTRPAPGTVRVRRVPTRPVAVECQRCGGPIDPAGRRYRYCSEVCFRKARNARGSGGVRRSASARGYDYAHAVLRFSTVEAAVGTPCVLCGGVMDDPARMHLDHTEDRTGYRGFAHDRCNAADGARRGGQAGRAKRLAEGRRPGA